MPPLPVPPLTLESEEVSRFNRRFGVRLADGARVEAVLYRGDTLCVSSQVGCAVGCPFCASGAQGLQRPLRFEELVGQVEAVEARHGPLRRLTLSGVGEPLHAPDAPRFVAWAKERGTPASLTTSGGPLRRLERWLRDVPHNGLTLSVHAGREPTRARLVPRGPSLAELVATLRAALPELSRRRKKKLALAYLVLAGENDVDAEVDAFAARFAPLGLAVHLYAYNPVPTSDAQPISRARYEALYARLSDAGLRVRMSSQARVEANGGCGTLVALRAAR
ncbi:MAG TPA: radical SAM protein [Polyangiaceae bacterium LLY-WYZ-15_(1-7)]|nr:radical SAM protein [Sandaracinus sp.]HJL01059.1 radical SAM protein [Polyangiaceae bacterium LLY-WYZ-15_(1-7)]HJL12099.1 radical SAM protein [Polyangiaceae bacterium LLY-WYZ-15_(1-7)]HJL30421.1 radical SAM protein [Polyangiaceae bacterium LLY-WYZ-15_(1-7)]HJL38755.1 radical SAM protein [Polyangiaceae bacterium LLY-WYZ-15_(1-7)]